MSLPPFLIKKTPKMANIRKLRARLGNLPLATVCEEAHCPNLGECFSGQTCTFLVLGRVCSRNCAFCGISKGCPAPPDPEEPERIAAAVEKLGLKYVVITSVTRDDLSDGGSQHFAKIITRLRNLDRGLKIEVLIPDFQGERGALETVLAAGPDVLNHNLETVPRLYPRIRPQADYQRSLELLSRAKRPGGSIYTKSGFMVGLGEKEGEVGAVLADLKESGCDIVTIGQYLSPSPKHLPPERYVEPSEFARYQAAGEALGLQVFAGPFVRSSYHAKEINRCLNSKKPKDC